MPYFDTGRISLHYLEAGSGGVTTLLLHELGGSSESWWRVMPLFAAKRRTIAVDLRNAGRSEKPPGAFDLTDAADDLAALIGGLGLGPVDVVGSALGSVVGALLAQRHPAAVRRMMLCAVAHDMGGPTADYVSKRAVRVRVEGMRGVAEASLANSFPDSHAAARSAYLPVYLANDPAAYAELSLALARAEMSEAVWGGIRAPVLVASGAHDFLWPPSVGQKVADRIPGARFAVLPDAGHFPHMHTPEDLVAMAQAFFAALS
ncbi:MAG: alpha/beta fold hydrolase [Acetobacteraceae bacterium]